MQRYYQSMNFGQFTHGGVQLFLQFRQVDFTSGSLVRNQGDQVRVVFSVKVQVVQTQVSLVLALLEEVDRFVHRDPVNPGEKARISFERLERLERLDERFLCQVVRVLVIRRHVVDGGVDALLV